MARQYTRKNVPIEESIRSQEEAVSKAKQKYDSEVAKLKDLYAKRDEIKKKQLYEAVEKSEHSYEEIMAYIQGGRAKK